MKLFSNNIWIGRWVMSVAIIHTLATGLFFSDQIIQIVKSGIFDSIKYDPMLNVAFWFFIFGPAIYVIGNFIHWHEKQIETPIPRSITWMLTIITAIGIIIVPASGFWLMLPPLIGLFKKQRDDEINVSWS